MTTNPTPADREKMTTNPTPADREKKPMKLQDQVVSLELAKKLKELGIKQNSLFWWVGGLLVFQTQTGFYNQAGAGMNLHPLIDKAISAYSIAELGEILTEHKQNFFPYFCDNPRELVWVHNFGAYPDYVSAKTEADCRAKMLIYLLENNLITL